MRLGVFEARLAIQEDRLRSSPYFDEDKPPRDFTTARLKLFSLFLSLGNLYGFARPVDPADTALKEAFAERAESYIQKAISLKPDIRQDAASTLGYASFCIAAIKGIRGLQLLNGNTVGQAEVGGVFADENANRLIHEAIKALERAKSHQHSPPFQYHLQGLLMFHIDRFDDAARAWKNAADYFKPPSSVMYFNCACALSKSERYSEALTELEHAISISDREVSSGIDLRSAARDADGGGAEFAPFWPGSPHFQADALNSRSASGKNFYEILRPRAP